jgi:hypothetical protein
MAEKKRSSALSREVQGYLKPGTHSLFNAYREINEMGKSEALNVMVKSFFDKLPAAERERILAISKNSH